MFTEICFIMRFFSGYSTHLIWEGVIKKCHILNKCFRGEGQGVPGCAGPVCCGWAQADSAVSYSEVRASAGVV